MTILEKTYQEKFESLNKTNNLVEFVCRRLKRPLPSFEDAYALATCGDSRQGQAWTFEDLIRMNELANSWLEGTVQNLSEEEHRVLFWGRNLNSRIDELLSWLEERQQKVAASPV